MVLGKLSAKISKKPAAPKFDVAVLGAGAWGTALAQCAAQAGSKVLLWDRDEQVAQDILVHQENRKRFPGFMLHDNVVPTADLARAAREADVIVVALPSDANTTIAAQLSAHLREEHVIVVASKGFRQSDGALLTTVWREAAPKTRAMAVLGGPTFAREMMERKVTAMLLACEDAEVRGKVASLWDVSFIRVYEGDDIIGAQVGGAIKNVLAVAAGILDGLEMGHNARAALLTRGLVEMGRYSKVLGGEAQTVWGLAGMGDVMLTATSTLSRNYRFGLLVGKGTPIPDAKLKVGTVEGILAARIVTVQAQAHGLDLAIVSAVDGILHGDVSPLQAVEYLMQRPRVEEFHS